MNARGRVPVRILIIEDDAGDVLMIREAFEGTGKPRTIDVAGDGQEALEFLRSLPAHNPSRRPDVILLDLNMPRLNGHETLVELKRHEDWREIPVIVFTTSRSQRDIRLSYANHANAYVAKPVDLAGFDDAINRIDEFFTETAALPT